LTEAVAHTDILCKSSLLLTYTCELLNGTSDGMRRSSSIRTAARRWTLMRRLRYGSWHI